MNKQRKVVITTTYNEMGIIIDTKVEELGTSARPEPCEDTVSRAWLLAEYDRQHQGPPGGARKIIETAPPVTPKQPEIIYCKDCVHNIEPEFGFCDRANHHVSLNSYCANVFHAERRDAE